MFESVITYLKSEVRNFGRLVADQTGALTETTKDEFRKKASEFEDAVVVLEAYAVRATDGSKNLCGYYVKYADCAYHPHHTRCGDAACVSVRGRTAQNI